MNDRRPQPKGIDRIAALLEPAFPVRMLGFGLVYAWSTCIWDLPILESVGFGGPPQNDASWMLSAALTPLACIAGSLAGRTRELAEFRSMYVIAPALTSLGTLCVVACPHAPEPLRTLLVACAGIGTGIGPVALILLWTCLFARTETGIVETVVPASFAATLVCALVVPSLPVIVSVATVAALPLASGALLLLSKHALDTGAVACEAPDENGHLRVRHANIARMFFIIFAVYGIGCMLPAASSAAVPTPVEANATIVGMTFAVALAAAIVLFSRRINLEALFRWITMPFALAIICAPFDSQQAIGLSRVLANVVFTGIEIIMVLYFVRLAQKTGRTSTFFVGIGECAAYTGVFAGYMAQPTIAQLLAASALDAKTLCLLLVGAFIAVTLLVPRHDATLDADTASETECAGVEGIVAKSAVGKRSAPHPESASAQGAVAVAEALVEHRVRIARSHGLSKRETEIFLLLAQGRSRPYIRDALVLSKNTVATHIRHIYEKLGIHSQQELIDLAEGAFERE